MDDLEVLSLGRSINSVSRRTRTRPPYSLNPRRAWPKSCCRYAPPMR